MFDSWCCRWKLWLLNCEIYFFCFKLLWERLLKETIKIPKISIKIEILGSWLLLIWSVFYFSNTKSFLPASYIKATVFFFSFRLLRIWALELGSPVTFAPVKNGLCCTYFPHGGIIATGYVLGKKLKSFFLYMKPDIQGIWVNCTSPEKATKHELKLCTFTSNQIPAVIMGSSFMLDFYWNKEEVLVGAFTSQSMGIL